MSEQQDPPAGEKWGEFPPAARQEELKGMLKAWDQKQDHRPGPFVDFRLTGADVYWLAALVAGEGDVGVGKKALDELPHPRLTSLNLKGAILFTAHLEGAILREAHLEGANLNGAHLVDANLNEAHLVDANLNGAHLIGTSLCSTQLEGTDLQNAWLALQVDLREATFDVKTKLAEAHFDATLRVADVVWNGVPLIRVAWEQVPHLGDEAIARQSRRSDGERKFIDKRAEEFEAAARAYRQLAIALRGQGITEAADRFTYRALIMQRKALWWHSRGREFSMLGSYLFSLFLAVLTGYGFRMWRIIAAYTLLILAFAGAYWSLDLQTPHIYTFWQALILSVTAFHGRVFSNPFLLTEPQIVVTAIEAIFGLVIEGVFIAMLTQRFFNR